MVVLINMFGWVVKAPSLRPTRTARNNQRPPSWLILFSISARSGALGEALR
jgi:hypothetical protein